jgi:fructose-1,6-bisphosphatase/inositol monophosphatase family enzyme
MKLPISTSGRTAMQVARDCGNAAGAIIRTAFDEQRSVSVKGNRNVVTETDLAVELAVQAILGREFPGHAILAEETASTTQSDGWMWVCDPVDGTKNFAQGIPHFAFSMALCHAGEPLLGLTTHPLLRWEFRAEKGAGCWLNDRRVMVTPRARLAESVVAIDLGYDDALGAGQLELARELWTNVQSIRTSGSAALGFAYLAAGKWDAYVHPSLAPWDSAAGIVLVEEAGGVVSDGEGRRATIHSERVITATPGIHGELLGLAARHAGGA